MPEQPSKNLEEIVHEVGRYPIDAFVFVQECLTKAADKVHGPMSDEQKRLAQWMARHDVKFDEVVEQWETGQLPPRVAELVEQMGGPQCMNRHVTGQQLCHAIRDSALEQWGLMARSVLARWSITHTEDIGAIIFALVDNHWLQKEPTDSIEDFANVFSFGEAFDRAYRIPAP